jgi:hypothetical protein
VLRRSEQTRFLSASDDEVGGLAMFAPPICRRRWRNNAFPFRQLRRRRRYPSEHRSERQRAIRHSAIRARDVRAADLQDEPTKRVEKELILRHNSFVGSDEDGGF